MDYNSLSKEQLIEIVQKLHRDKKYGLIWEKKPKILINFWTQITLF